MHGLWPLKGHFIITVILGELNRHFFTCFLCLLTVLEANNYNFSVFNSGNEGYCIGMQIVYWLVTNILGCLLLFGQKFLHGQKV